MPQHAVPLETDILCEHCGYGLNGLPDTGLCPECGQPIADSTVADGRRPPAWEAFEGTTAQRFFRTTSDIVRQPAVFFRTLQTRQDDTLALQYANRQHGLSAIVLGIATALHMDLFQQMWPYVFAIYAFLPLIAVTWLSLRSITRLAALLTRLEGAYWGYRMPAVAVRRAMHYHSAQLLPVAVVFFLYIVGYRILQDTGLFHVTAQVPYLYILSGLVVISAGYLFRTYWIAMKNIMYANR